MRLPGTICFEIAFCQPLHARVRVQVKPSLADQVKGQLPLLNRSMTQLANIAERNLLTSGGSHGKTHCVPLARDRKMWTGGSVSQFAELAKVRVGRHN